MDEKPKSPFKGLPPPGLKQATAIPRRIATPQDFLPRIHITSGDDLPKTPRWKKILAALFRVSTVVVPSAGAGYVAAEVRVMEAHHPAPAASITATPSESGQTVASAHIDQLVPVLVVLVAPEENTDVKRAETKTILEQALEFAKGLPVDLGKDAVKDLVKGTLVGGPLIALAGFLAKRNKETGNKSVGWCGTAVAKIAELLGKHSENVITDDQIQNTFGPQTLAAKTLLLTLGFKKQGDGWRRA